jgi:hypothetical protein
VAIATSGTASAKLFGRIRERLRDRVDASLDKLRKELDTLRGPGSCPDEFRAALDRALDARKACLVDPPPGSPLDSFEKLSEKQADAFCGKRNDRECEDLVLDQQQSFCRDRTAQLLAAATKKRAQCAGETAKRFGGKVRDRVKEKVGEKVENLRKRIGALDAALPDRPCAREFGAALKDALDAQRQCFADPPAGSPIDRFEKLSDAEQDAQCGKRTDVECLEVVLLVQQEAFCAQRNASLVKQATEKRIACSTEAVKRFPGKVRERVKQGVENRVEGFRQRIDNVRATGKCADEIAAAVAEAVTTKRKCLSDPPPGSPIGKFEKLSEEEADAFCGSRNDQQCLVFLLDEQEKFCAPGLAARVDAVVAKQQECKKRESK